MSERATCPRSLRSALGVSRGCAGAASASGAMPLLSIAVVCHQESHRIDAAASVKAPEVARRQQTRNALVLRGCRVSASAFLALVGEGRGVRSRGPVRGRRVRGSGTIALPWLQRQRVRTPAAALRDQDGPRATTSLDPPAKIETVAQTGLLRPHRASQRDGVAGILGFPDPHHGRVSSTSDHNSQSAGKRWPCVAPNLVTEFQPPAQPGGVGFLGRLASVRSGDYPGAIAGMRRALRAAPTSALAEDARYWEAVALARQGSWPNPVR